jgi:hypothetical protein
MATPALSAASTLTQIVKTIGIEKRDPSVMQSINNHQRSASMGVTEPGHRKLSVGAIAGIAAGSSVFLLSILVVVVLYLIKNRKRRKLNATIPPIPYQHHLELHQARRPSSLTTKDHDPPSYLTSAEKKLGDIVRSLSRRVRKGNPPDKNKPLPGKPASEGYNSSPDTTHRSLQSSLTFPTSVIELPGASSTSVEELNPKSPSFIPPNASELPVAEDALPNRRDTQPGLELDTRPTSLQIQQHQHQTSKPEVVSGLEVVSVSSPGGTETTEMVVLMSELQKVQEQRQRLERLEQEELRIRKRLSELGV